MDICLCNEENEWEERLFCNVDPGVSPLAAHGYRKTVVVFSGHKQQKPQVIHSSHKQQADPSKRSPGRLGGAEVE